MVILKAKISYYSPDDTQKIIFQFFPYNWFYGGWRMSFFFFVLLYRFVGPHLNSAFLLLTTSYDGNTSVYIFMDRLQVCLEDGGS